jgi:flagellar motor switch/type III secretory pathway protein FliN
MNVVPFRLYDTANCRRIGQGLTAVLTAWSRDWLATSDVDVSFRNVKGGSDPALDQLKRQSRVLGSVATDALFVVSSGGKLSNLLQLLPEPDGDYDKALKGRLQDELALRCIEDLYCLISGQVTVSRQLVNGEEIATATLKRVFRPGSGWGVLSIGGSKGQLLMLLGQEHLRRYVEPRLPLEPLGGLAEGFSALLNQAVTVSAELGSTSLTIGDFRNLAVGDVVRLDQSCDAPIDLRVGRGRRLAFGQLGTQGGSKAVRLQGQV